MCIDSILRSSLSPLVKKEGGPAAASAADKTSRSLDERLIETHVSESLRTAHQWSSHLNPCSNLLGTMVGRGAAGQDRLVLTLLPAKSGYLMHMVSEV